MKILKKNDGAWFISLRNIHCLVGLLCLASLPFTTAAEPEPSSPANKALAAYANHRDLQVVADQTGKLSPVKTADDWHKRRSHILLGMQQAMGPLPDRNNLPELDVRVTETVQVDGLTRIKMTIAAEEGDRLPLYLFLPQMKLGERRPAVLALHPTGAPGKDIVSIVGGGKENRQYALELAQRGYVVVAPDYPSFGEAKEYNFEKDRYVSGTMKGIWNHMRCVDFLQSRPEVDGEKIAAIGHSLGGHNAMFVGVFDERIKVIVSSCGWTPFHDYYAGKIAGWTSDRYMPLLKTRYELNADLVPFDFYEIVAALAPRTFFSASPLHDSNFEVSGVRKAEAVAKPIFSLLGAESSLQIAYPDCAHDFPPDMRQQAYSTIDQTFKFQPVRKVP